MKYYVSEDGKHEYIQYNGMYFWHCPNNFWRIVIDGEPSPISISKKSNTSKRLNEFLERVRATETPEKLSRGRKRTS